MIRLGVNIDHVATLRNARGERYPCPVKAAAICELAGADNITCHLREDRRHILDRDVYRLKDSLDIPLNFEMAFTPEMMAIALDLKPHAVTLVPEKREELTTESGLDLKPLETQLSEAVKRLHDQGILVCLFIDPVGAQVELAARVGADVVEIHTGEFCHQVAGIGRRVEGLELLKPYQECEALAVAAGLQFHVGHGLNYHNAGWMQFLGACQEANIGHAIVSHAVFVGLEAAVREMKQLLNNPVYAPRLAYES